MKNLKLMWIEWRKLVSIFFIDCTLNTLPDGDFKIRFSVFIIKNIEDI